MASKKNIEPSDIINYYMDYVLENYQQPKSVFVFSKMNNFDESKFYEYFASFEMVEKTVFKVFFENTIKTLNASKDYENYDQRNKLLSFYFTFFETLTANRSFVLYTLNKHKNSLKNLATLSLLKADFISYIEHLKIEVLDIKDTRLIKIQDKAIKESAWIQLLLTIKFWIDDSSAKFEKTDIFIEKAVNTSFDILNIAPLKSVLDFGKFLYKEKVHMN